MKLVKKSSFLLAVLCCVCIAGSGAALASEETPTMEQLVQEANLQRIQMAQDEGYVVGEKYTYTYEDGQVQEFYFDEDYNPYGYDANGDEMYLMLPLPCLRITDERLLAIIEDSSKPQEGVSPFALPSNAYDLTNPYVNTVDFTRGALQLAVKIPASYSGVALKTDQYNPSGVGNKNLIIAYSVYTTVTGEIEYSSMLNGVNCSNGLAVKGLMTPNRHMSFTIWSESPNLRGCRLSMTHLGF